jgi:hypothetical protein
MEKIASVFLLSHTVGDVTHNIYAVYKYITNENLMMFQDEYLDEDECMLCDTIIDITEICN